MAIFSTANTKVRISDAATTQDADEAAVKALTFVDIGKAENIGSVGGGAEEVTFQSINELYATKMKGTRDSGTMELTMGFDATDAGQLALIAAEKTDGYYGFELEFNDAPTGGTPSKVHFVALVMSVQNSPDSANSVSKLVSNLSITNAVHRTMAAPA